ncbi:hypothetical protein CBL_06096 [Carabus blaptoides fortunei]
MLSQMLRQGESARLATSFTRSTEQRVGKPTNLFSTCLVPVSNAGSGRARIDASSCANVTFNQCTITMDTGLPCWLFYRYAAFAKQENTKSFGMFSSVKEARMCDKTSNANTDADIRNASNFLMQRIFLRSDAFTTRVHCGHDDVFPLTKCPLSPLAGGARVATALSSTANIASYAANGISYNIWRPPHDKYAFLCSQL